MTVQLFDIGAAASRRTRKDRGEVLAGFNGGVVGVASFSSHPRWERHPHADELLQVLDGELDLTILDGDERTELVMTPGTVVVVPRGLWHSPRPRGLVRLFFINTLEETETSNLDDPS